MVMVVGLLFQSGPTNRRTIKKVLKEFMTMTLIAIRTSCPVAVSAAVVFAILYKSQYNE